YVQLFRHKYYVNLIPPTGNNMYKYNPFIMQNIRANTLIIGANNNPINKKVRLNADFSINYKKTALLFAHL
ncbi:hypothetical protein, partial [Bacteroides uniformis]